MFQKRTHLTQFRYYISYAKQIHNTYKSFLLAQQKMKKKNGESKMFIYYIASLCYKTCMGREEQQRQR